MKALTISQVSKSFRVSTRMLRYYEQLGLLESHRREDYAYRMYDEAALSRLQQILILRRLRIPLKQIQLILEQPIALTALKVFQDNINELSAEITALSTIKTILSRFVDVLHRSTTVQIQGLITEDETVLAAIESLSQTSIYFKEDKTMEKLNQAETQLPKLKDVRIIYLPPSTVAAAHYIGDEPEAHVNTLLGKFVRETELWKIKPDIRHYGFNHPNPVDETGFHGYEMWVTIPEELEVPPPLQKKYFAGGLYAAHMIPMGNFHEWDWLYRWVFESEKYEFAGDLQDQEHMCGLLEEHLNYVNHIQLENTEPEDLQLDLLAPVKLRSE